jgi:hypothetical protein
MLFKHGDMPAFIVKLLLKYERRTVFNYSSGNSNGGQDIYIIPSKKLVFIRVGVKVTASCFP